MADKDNINQAGQLSKQEKGEVGQKSIKTPRSERVVDDRSPQERADEISLEEYLKEDNGAKIKLELPQLSVPEFQQYHQHSMERMTKMNAAKVPARHEASTLMDLQLHMNKSINASNLSKGEKDNLTEISNDTFNQLNHHTAKHGKAFDAMDVRKLATNFDKIIQDKGNVKTAMTQVLGDISQKMVNKIQYSQQAAKESVQVQQLTKKGIDLSAIKKIGSKIKSAGEKFKNTMTNNSPILPKKGQSRGVKT
ncbi:hypothetical protein [Rickettsiales endosymbiont of Stachyamoeba lipophora]|uniref:hypothetical protein n=1 Tax=Rickettsiales endosymbiont of Stachyamoeba lipophora TaxID=2486578 RepID=UPI000F64D055|nr:hypothetical protein [Rickettsiales endosymbiont of Stachyamoeba lipophora]AZL15682.1 hypothetical protein EF513_03845 [Rickettsiales endosymbiont of Stachyamoeba lipophora]